MKTNMTIMLTLLAFSSMAFVRVEAAAQKLLNDVIAFDENVRNALSEGYSDEYAEYVTGQIAEYRVDATKLDADVPSNKSIHDTALSTLAKLDKLLMYFAASAAGAGVGTEAGEFVKADTFGGVEACAYTKSGPAATTEFGAGAGASADTETEATAEDDTFYDAEDGAGTTEEAPTNVALVPEYFNVHEIAGFGAGAGADFTESMNPLAKQKLESQITSTKALLANKTIEKKINIFISCGNTDLCALLDSPSVKKFFYGLSPKTLVDRLDNFIAHIFFKFLLTNFNAKNRDKCFRHIATLITNFEANKDIIFKENPYRILTEEDVIKIIRKAKRVYLGLNDDFPYVPPVKPTTA